MAKNFLDSELDAATRQFTGNELRYVQEALASGRLSSLSGGTFTKRFEEAFAKTIGAKHAIAVHSCMSALHAAVLAAGVHEGDAVICDPEFIFGSMAVLYCNGIPTYVDIDPVTHNMDASKLEAAITERTKAVIVTHAWGLPAEIDKIVDIAHRHNLLVIEDCAESVLAPYKGRYTGTWGDMGCFSFQAHKQMSLGDGGMATTNNDDLAKALGKHAGAPTWLSVAYGLDYNYRMNEQTAAIGLAQTEVLPQIIEKMRINAGHFTAAVADFPWLKLQQGPAGAESSWYMWVATFEGEAAGLSLEDFKCAVTDAKLPLVSLGYTNMPAYDHPVIRERRAHAFHCAANAWAKDLYRPGLCPVAERAIPRILMACLTGSEDLTKRVAAGLHQAIVQLTK
jgi:perosamine synthetase